ncbi:MAG: DNA topoisomerase [Cyanobacteria bacterium J06592_8]
MRTSSSTETAKTLRVRQLLHLGRPQDRTGLTGVRAALCHLPSIELENVRSSQHQTEPPKRFTEPSLVKMLEQTGVGRPSTYANIINTLFDRVYVTLNKKSLRVTELGLKVDEFLSKVVPDVIDPGFTAQLEKNLDEIASGQLNWEQWLIDWNSQVFQPALNQGNQAIEQAVSGQLTDFTCPVCGAKLEKHQYTKNRELKTMLRCSQSRHPNCQDVTYFQAQGVFWSPKFGELPGQVKPKAEGYK